MAALLPQSIRDWLASAPESKRRTLLLLALAALVMRCWQFGNPVVQIDEQFYLLAGDRLLQGALPFVDIWDRKPVGLFLLYAAIRLLGGEGILQYQLVATLFAIATAYVIARAGARVGGSRGGLLAALIYLIFLMVNGGDGGQSPVFYNLLVGLTGWTIMRLLDRPGFDRTSFAMACFAMALMGVAIQIKYSVIFEGAFFGLTLLWVAWRRGTGPATVLAMGAAWLAIALLPTVAAFAWYAQMGHGQVFWYANFESIFSRTRPPYVELLNRIKTIIRRLLPVAVVALIACWPQRPRLGHGGERDVRRFLAGWAIVAVLAVLGFGGFHDHYALPLLVPFTIAGAALYGDPLAGVAIAAHGRVRLIQASWFIAVLGLWMGYTIVEHARWERGSGREARAIAAIVKPRLHDCLFAFDGDPILYHLTGSCLPTRWVFPSELNDRDDIQSVGTDTMRELRRIMAAKPQFVVMRDVPFVEADPAAWTFMEDTLARDYRVIYAAKTGRKHQQLFERLPGR